MNTSKSSRLISIRMNKIFSALFRTKGRFVLVMAVCLLLPDKGLAVYTIEVNKGVEAGIPIAIVPFGALGLDDSQHRPADIISANLSRTGKFEMIPRPDFPGQPTDRKSVQFKDWRQIKAEALVVGQVIDIGNGQYEVRFSLLDVFRQRTLEGQKFHIEKANVRKVAHQISNLIYQHFTGNPGAFDTRIAYVHVEGDETDRKYRLQIADADGYNPKTILTSSQPVLSPAWSPDGKWISYVSFEKKRSIIFMQNIWTGQRRLISEELGINSSPAWSPDGRYLAITLSKDGNADIYLHDLEQNRLRRVTQHPAIDTEASFSPDGRRLVFTSGRAGAPQLYELSLDGRGSPRRLTQGEYNAKPSYSPDGKHIVMITDQGNGFRVGIYSVGDPNGTVTELTDTTQDESPSFAPNGEMIIYATRQRRQDMLAVVSADGVAKQTLPFQQGSVREPAWAPFNRNP